MALCILRLCSLLLVLSLFIAQCVATQSAGIDNSCTLKSGRAGVCKFVHDCDLWSLLKEGSEPTICETISNSKIICCPKQLSKSQEKCLEYNKIKCPNSTSRSLSSTSLILNGEKVKRVEDYPHMALLGYGSKNSKVTWECGGTLISEEYVLTAAHCVENRDRVPVTVAHLGFLNKHTRNEFNTLQEFRIIKRIKYPDRRAPKVYHDIALLKLDRPARLSKAVLPACLHEEAVIPDAAAIYATGWGQIKRDSREASDDLMRVKLKQFDQNYCSLHFPKDRKLPEGVMEATQFCAGDDNKDTCYGDSGGPLQISRKDVCMHSVVGITSVGIDCGVKPGIYTRVSSYVSWIESVVWPDT